MSVGHYENFPVASALLPAHLRPAVIAIYQFARAADDLADEGEGAPADRLAALESFGEKLSEIERGRTPAEAPFPALAAAIRTHALPLSPFRDLLSAFMQDVTIARYASFVDLLDYCRRSANPVGRLLLALYRAESPANAAASDAICTGLQLTNFWQDIALDWQKGRVYLPQEDLARFAVVEAEIETQIEEARVDERWRRLLEFEVSRARALFERGRSLPRALPWRQGLELSAVVAGGLRILERIDAVGGNVFSARPTLATWDWLTVALRAMTDWRRGDVEVR
ncbi:MAG: squalene synthase HpnC [Betaproteobacteria bacterium]|nr:squalene synthase HpnC [Betaproteobacteria bacterium]